MNLKEIQQLIEIVEASGLDEVIIREGESKITLRRNVAVATAAVPAALPVVATTPSVQTAATKAATPEQPTPATVPVTGDLLEVRSPIVGTFYRAPSPDSEPFVAVNDRVSAGDVLCIIEAMKLMNEIESDVTGTIVEILAENGQAIEFNQVLFRLKP